jgi:hypothetical protein
MTIFPNHKKRFALLCVLLVCTLAFWQHTEVTIEDIQTITGAKTFKLINGMAFADAYATGGSGTTASPYTSATGTGGIQEAINCGTVNGGHVHIRQGFYSITAQILLNNSCFIDGDGWASGSPTSGSVLYVSAALGATTDVLHVQGTPTLIEGLTLKDFAIVPVSGTPGQYGIHLDAGTSAIGDIVIQNVRVDTLGNYGLQADNPNNLFSGGVFLLSIRDSVIRGGLNLSSVGDSILLERNNILGPRDLKVNLIGAVAHSDGGAHGLQILHNNITTTGGIVVQNAWQAVFAYNDVEATATSTEANNCLLDLQGNVTSPIQEFQVIGNYMGANSSFVADNIRIDRAVSSVIRDNYATRGTGVAFRITANADRTIIADNRYPLGELITTYLADLGTNTQVDYMQPNSNIRQMLPSFAVGISSSGTPTLFASAATSPPSWRAGSGGIFCFTSGADPSSTGCDGGFSRLGAGQISVDTSSLNNSLGSIVQTGGIDLGAANFRGSMGIGASNHVLVSATAPTISTHFNTSGDSIVTNGTGSFTVTVGSGVATSTGALTLPTATTGWTCWVTNQSRADHIQQTGSTTASMTKRFNFPAGVLQDAGLQMRMASSRQKRN